MSKETQMVVAAVGNRVTLTENGCGTSMCIESAIAYADSIIQAAAEAEEYNLQVGEGMHHAMTPICVKTMHTHPAHVHQTPAMACCTDHC